MLIERIKCVDYPAKSCADSGVYWLTKFEFTEPYRARHGSP